jgi:predicted protein tyrosine phosphatase
MDHPTLVVLGYSEAAMFLRATPRPNVTAIISIHGHREYGVEAEVMHRLDLTFDDVEVVAPGDVLALQRAFSRRRWGAENGLTELAPSASDAASIIQFAEAVRETEGIILCHCGGGMSRAPAAALICLALWKGPGTEAECVREVLAIRRGAVPHPGLVRFADELLRRDGALVCALASIGREPRPAKPGR